MISIIIPVIRPQKLDLLFKLLGEHAGIGFELIYEEDKERIGCPKMIKRLVEKTGTDYVMFLGDDVIPLPNFAKNAFNEMQKIEWGLIGLNDMFTPNPTHWLAHKKLLPELGGEFFYTGYKHCCCDQELMIRAKKLGRYIWCEEARAYHNHPIFTDAELDDDYKRAYSQEWREHDEKLFFQRNKLVAG